MKKRRFRQTTENWVKKRASDGIKMQCNDLKIVNTPRDILVALIKGTHFKGVKPLLVGGIRAGSMRGYRKG